MSECVSECVSVCVCVCVCVKLNDELLSQPNKTTSLELLRLTKVDAAYCDHFGPY